MHISPASSIIIIPPTPIFPSMSPVLAARSMEVSIRVESPYWTPRRIRVPKTVAQLNTLIVLIYELTKMTLHFKKAPEVVLGLIPLEH